MDYKPIKSDVSQLYSLVALWRYGKFSNLAMQCCRYYSNVFSHLLVLGKLCNLALLIVVFLVHHCVLI